MLLPKPRKAMRLDGELAELSNDQESHQTEMSALQAGRWSSWSSDDLCYPRGDSKNIQQSSSRPPSKKTKKRLRGFQVPS